MFRFYAATFTNMNFALERVRGLLLAEAFSGQAMEADSRLLEVLDQVDKDLKALPFSATLRSGVETLRKSARQGADQQFLATLLVNLENSIQTELSEWLFLAVQPNKRIFYMTPEQWFGDEVLQAYPDSEADLRSAARCIALDEWTACVFHLMRGVEAALRKWSDQLGLLLKMPVIDANWQDILSEADKALKALEQQPKSQQRNEDLEYFGETAAQFRAIKNAWRNHVAHSKRSYDERDAVEVMQHVTTFMRKLARRK